MPNVQTIHILHRLLWQQILRGMEKYVGILLSRQPLRPCGNTAWVDRTVAALRWVKQLRMGVFSSIGMQTWELITAVSSDLGLPIKLVLPVASGSEFDKLGEQTLHEYNLDPTCTKFMPVSGDSTDSQRNDLMKRRDDDVFNAADLLLPISVSPKGSMSRRLDAAESEDRAIETHFRVPHRKRSEPIKVDIDPDRLRDEITEQGDDYLIHWTRGVSHPWPDERMIDYYRAIVRSDHWPRSGLVTMLRILDSRNILASSRHMPGKAMTVSFSALRPSDVIPFMRWRARFGEMSFEPYGIGLTREVAEQSGVLPVSYYDLDDKKSVPSEETDNYWLTQSRGKITDWQMEREHRHLGDFSFKRIRPEAIVLFCRSSAEADRLRSRYPYRVISLMK